MDQKLVHSLPNDLQFKILSLLTPPSLSSAIGSVPVPKPNLRVRANVIDILNRLDAEGHCIVDDFLDIALANSLLTTCKDLEQNGQLRPAKMGTGVTQHSNEAIRGDKLRFLLISELTANTNELPATFTPFKELKQHFDTLSASLNDKLPQNASVPPFTSKGLQVAFYPGNGARYVKHRDASPLNPNRRITMILYLNKDWSPKNGGQLRIYRSEKTPDTAEKEHNFEDISPLFNRLLVFRSDMEHEVLESFGDRFAVTMWLYSPHDLDATLAAYRNTQRTPNNDTIFVSIPSYRDPETKRTVESLLSTANNPSRIHVGILYQDDPIEDAAIHDHTSLPNTPNIRVTSVPISEAKGPAYARRIIAQTLYKHEKYYFQIDSHCRFAKGWDTLLISSLLAAPHPAKSLITMYPPPYTLPDILSKPPYGPVIMRPEKFDDDGMLRITGRLTFPPPPPQHDEPDTLISQKFIAAGCLFAPAKELLTDLNEGGGDAAQWAGLFFGEEVAQSAILWTRGWRFWTPRDGTKPIIWHLWQRSYRRTFQENMDSDAGGHGSLKEVRAVSQKRIRVSLRMENGEVDRPLVMGEGCTLAEFEGFVGVKFAEKRIE
ncbi:Egl nine 3 [Rhizophlyctis rosea]|nr:Egl nine 3 [Rhizophlyctis rosea]